MMFLNIQASSLPHAEFGNPCKHHGKVVCLNRNVPPGPRHLRNSDASQAPAVQFTGSEAYSETASGVLSITIAFPR